jgi:hypothetical protein
MGTWRKRRGRPKGRRLREREEREKKTAVTVALPFSLLSSPVNKV